MIPAVPASPLTANVKVPEVGALTRATGEIAISIISTRLAVSERCRRGVEIFSVSDKSYFQSGPELV